VADGLFQTFGQAKADVSAPSDGEAHAECSTFSRVPFPDEQTGIYYGLISAADVTTMKRIVLTSATDPVGTPVDVTLDVSYGGLLQAVQGPGSGEAELWTRAYAEGLAAVVDSQDSVLWETEGEVALDAFIGGDIYQYSGDWVENPDVSMSPTENPGEYVFDYSHTVEFTATIGETYGVYFDLATTATTSDGLAEGDVTSGWAVVDFYNTGTYELTTPEGVGVTHAPEPTTMVLLGLGGLGILRRRRRAA
jgi:hypothetical protein